jgi:carboxyl-terminal processing protease
MMPKFNLPKLELAKLRKYFLIIFSVVILFGSGYFLGYSAYKVDFKNFPKVTVSRGLPVDKNNLDFSLFWQVWDTLNTKYYDKDKIIASDMVYGAIEGMVSSLDDPYTVFLPPSKNRVVNEDLNGSFEGVGIQIGFKGTQLAVVAPLPGSPAEKEGVKPGDFIIGITDEAKEIERGTVGMSLSEAVEIIRGKAGTKVTLTILRDGESEALVKTITRQKIDVPTIILSYIGEGGSIAYLRLLKFGSETDTEWKKTVSEILGKKEATKMILDLRNNPGGYMQGAIDIASEFLKLGSVVVSEQRGEEEKVSYKVEKMGLLQNMPVIVLINQGSASASEILAGALRDNKKIKLVGETSFGKGTIQEPDELPGGSGIHITIAKWLTPSGYWVDEKGLEPDIEIEDNSETTEDEQLQKAIEVLNSK